MSQSMNPEEVRAYWTRQALEHGGSPAASWSDREVIEMEIRQLAARLQDGDRVLDAGCANGYTTVRLAAERNVTVRGLDYIPEMIYEARRRSEGLPEPLRRRLEFAVDDITALSEPDAVYDSVVVVRVLINLGEPNLQRAGLLEALRVLRPGGRLLLSEATLQGWNRLNALRREFGLPKIPMPDFNRYLDVDWLREAASPVADLVEVADFASSYFVMTRLVKPLLARVQGLPDSFVFDPASEWNRWAALLPAAGDYGTQKLFVLVKR